MINPFQIELFKFKTKNRNGVFFFFFPNHAALVRSQQRSVLCNWAADISHKCWKHKHVTVQVCVVTVLSVHSCINASFVRLLFHQSWFYFWVEKWMDVFWWTVCVSAKSTVKWGDYDQRHLSALIHSMQ